MLMHWNMVCLVGMVAAIYTRIPRHAAVTVMRAVMRLYIVHIKVSGGMPAVLKPVGVS